MARIGVYGGTFNPIHNTHIGIAKAALSQYKLDKVYFLVAGTPPHKNTADGISDFNRLEMVRLAIKNIPYFDIDEREIMRAGKSYSYITFTEYHNEMPENEIFFIMGSDSLINFKNWVKPDVISEYATVLVAPRAGDDTATIEHVIFECKNMFDGIYLYTLMAAMRKARGTRCKKTKMENRTNYKQWCIAISQKAEMRCTIFLS